ncbi:SDR family NAD(P)-dependent oxidoreductase [Bounagaea algeriensis]
MHIESGQVAVVTGAAQGLGRAIAAELVQRGVSVVLADVGHAAVERTAAELAAGGGVTMPVGVDVTDAAALAALAERVLERFGRIDLVVNNAGIAPGEGRPLWEVDLAEWRRVLDVDLFGVLHGIRAFVPHLVAAGRGHVVNIASIAGLSATPLAASYSTAKHGVVALSEALHAELGLLRLPIGVTAVCPGFVRTPMAEGTAESTSGSQEWVERLGTEASAALAEIEETMRDMLEPDEAARRVLAAVEADQLHVLPSGDVRDGARSRTQRVLDAIDASS